MLTTEVVIRPNNYKKFKFENSWLLEPDIDEVVSRGWMSCSNPDALMKLNACAEVLESWGRKVNSKFRGGIDDCCNQLESLCSQLTDANAPHFLRFKRCMSQLLVQEDNFLKQRAKPHWLKNGDLNTKHFHATTTGLQKTN